MKSWRKWNKFKIILTMAKKKEQKQPVNTEELPKLVVSGIINYEVLEKMSEDRRLEFVVNHIKTVLVTGTVSDKKGPLVEKRDKKKYIVEAEYRVIDTRYNHRGTMTATMTFQRATKDKVKIEEQKPINYESEMYQG